MDAAEQSNFLESAEEAFEDRLKKGEETYESHVKGFQGEAWQHTWEEALDTVVDLFWLGRYVDYLEQETRNLRDENEELKEENRLLKEGPGA